MCMYIYTHILCVYVYIYIYICIGLGSRACVCAAYVICIYVQVHTYRWGRGLLMCHPTAEDGDSRVPLFKLPLGHTTLAFSLLGGTVSRELSTNVAKAPSRMRGTTKWSSFWSRLLLSARGRKEPTQSKRNYKN